MKTLLIYLCFLFSILAADASADLAQTIDQLLAVVDKSDAKFIRNGDEHSGKEAAVHMRRKYLHFKKQIKSPEDFIEKCATQSELSGKPYKIKTADGKIITGKEWMLQSLAGLRKETK